MGVAYVRKSAVDYCIGKAGVPYHIYVCPKAGITGRLGKFINKLRKCMGKSWSGGKI